jgi:hypothetical protein
MMPAPQPIPGSTDLVSTVSVSLVGAPTTARCVRVCLAEALQALVVTAQCILGVTPVVYFWVAFVAFEGPISKYD